jgi:tetratricopeptide (TPR) repeat protein
MIYPFFGKHEKAIEEAKRAIGIDPGFPFAYVNLATAYQFLDRMTEAEAAFERASQHKVSVPEALGQRYDLAFLRGDKAEMDQLVGGLIVLAATKLSAAARSVSGVRRG